MSTSSPSISTPNDFVSIPITTSADDLVDAAIAALQVSWPNWVPSDANFEVALLEVIANMVAQLAQVAANMPIQAFIVFAQSFLGLDYGTGSEATAVATFTAQDTAGYTIDAGSALYLGGVEFQVLTEIDIAEGDTDGTGTVIASDVGAVGNGLTASGWAPASLPASIVDVSLAAPTSGGSDPQDTQDFLNEVAQYLKLRAKSIITLLDFEIAALQQLTTDIGGGRATAWADGSHPRNITVAITDGQGEIPTPDEIAAVQSALSDPNTRMVNAVISVVQADYCTIGGSFDLLASANVDTSALLAAATVLLDSIFNPAYYGTPTAGQLAGQTWVNQPIIPVNQIVALLTNLTGAQYCISFTFNTTGAESLSAALSTGGAITHLPLSATTTGLIPSGSVITVTDPTGVHTQTFTTTADAAVGTTSLPIASATPTYAFPTTSLLTVPIKGDLTMPGNAPLPQAGTFTGTITTAS